MRGGVPGCGRPGGILGGFARAGGLESGSWGIEHISWCAWGGRGGTDGTKDDLQLAVTMQGRLQGAMPHNPPSAATLIPFYSLTPPICGPPP